MATETAGLRMLRVVPFLILPLIATAPLASGQTETVEPRMEVHVNDFPGPIAPLDGVETAAVAVRVPCALAFAGPAPTAPAPVDLRVVESPDWVVPTLSPSTVHADPGACETTGLSTTATAQLIVSTTAEAPAFTPTPVVVEASLTGPGGTYTARDEVPVEADYFSIVDDDVAHAIQTGKPQSQLAYPITLHNRGNAATRILFDVVEITEGFSVVAPAPITLESKQAGGKLTKTTVNVMVQTPYRNGFVNEVGTVQIRWTAAHSGDETVRGDSGGISLMATSKGFYAPGPGLLLAVAFLGLTARLYLRGRMHRRSP